MQISVKFSKPCQELSGESKMHLVLNSAMLKVAVIRGLFGKFVEFGHKIFKYIHNRFIFFLNITGGH